MKTKAIRPAIVIAGAVVAVSSAYANWPGRMTGGGSIFCSPGFRVTHGFELHCGVGAYPDTVWPFGGGSPELPNNLEINWGGGNNFHLTTLNAANCFPDPAIAQGNPKAVFNTMWGYAHGVLNKAPATIAFVLTDAGEPGKDVDVAGFQIKNARGVVVVDCSGHLERGGNHQAHQNKKRIRKVPRPAQ